MSLRSVVMVMRNDLSRRKADAGFISEEAIMKFGPKGSQPLKEMEQMKIIGYTDYMPNWIFGANKRLESKVTKKVKKSLLKLRPGDKVLKAAEMRRFVPLPANYLEEFQAKIKGE